MRRSFRLRLALLCVLVAVLAILVVGVIADVSGGRRFSRYLSDVQQRNDAVIVQALGEAYRKGVGWDAPAIYALSQAARMADVNLAVYGRDGKLRFTVEGMRRRSVTDAGGATPAASPSGSAGSVDTSGAPIDTSGASVDVAALDIREHPIVVDGEGVGRVKVYAWSDPRMAAETTYEDAVRRDLVIAALIAALVATGVAVILSRHVTRLLGELARAAEDVIDGNLEARVSPHGDDEVATLAVAFNVMADGLARDEQWRRDMTADLSDELRAPLAAIQSRLAALETGATPATPDDLRAMSAEVERLGRLLGALHTLNELESEDLGVEHGRLGLGEVVTDAVAAVQVAAVRKQVAVTTDLAPAAVRGDRDRLRRAVADLLDNALKFTPPGGTVAVCLRVEAGSAVLSITDTGPGIDPVDLPFVFDRFYRSRSARGTQGVGLGLAVVKGLVEAHGGAVDAANAPEGGALFTVRLPLAG